MGRKIFISYKYADNDVHNISGNFYGCTVRNYVDKLEDYFDSSDNIYKGESDGEDLSQLSDDAIWKKLKDRIYDSTLTIIMISKNMKERYRQERDQWIPWEISYSLKEMSRKNSSGVSIASKTNALLGIVVPDLQNSYTYFTYQRNCCNSPCTTYNYNNVFSIMKNNMFNSNTCYRGSCDNGESIWRGNYSYLSSVKWCDFVRAPDQYIEKAYDIQRNLDDYSICKEV